MPGTVDSTREEKPPEVETEVITPLETAEGDTSSKDGSNEGQQQTEQHIFKLKSKQTVALGNVTKKRNELLELMSDAENLSAVKSNFDEYNQRYAFYKQAHELHYDALVTADKDTDKEESRFLSKQTSILQFRKQVGRWIKKIEDDLTEELNEASQLVTMVKNSRLKRDGSQCSNETQNSTRSARLLEKAKIAELRVEREMLRRRHQLEMEEKCFDIECKLAKAEARERIYALDENDDEVRSGDGMNSYFEKNVKDVPRPVILRSKVVPTAGEVNKGGAAAFPQVNRPVPSVQQTDANADNRSNFNVNAPEFIMRPADTMQPVDATNQALSILSLPQPEVPKFEGETINYRTFIMAFDARIGSRLSGIADKLYYLDQCLKGEAKDLIAGCLDLDPESGYAEARTLLEKEYGDPYKIGMVYLQKIQHWSLIKADDCIGLKKFSVFLSKCKTSMNCITYLNVLNHPPNMLSIVQKLPMYLQNKWRELASRTRMEKGRILDFSDLAAFVSLAAETANDPVYGKSRVSENPGKGNQQKSAKQKASSFITNVKSTENKSDKTFVVRKPCAFCKESHDLDDCDKFNKKAIDDKKLFLKENGLCFACFGKGHIAKGCRARRKCSICHRRHPTSLHVDMPDQEKVDDTSCTATEVHGSGTIYHGILPVKVYQKGSKSALTTYAFYDDGSSGCFITSDLMKKMSAVGVETVLQLKTMHGCSRSSSMAVEGLVVTDICGNNAVSLPRTYTREEIPVNRSHIPSPSGVRKWKHLRRIADKIPRYMAGVEVGILIGSNCSLALEPLEVIPTVSANGLSPYALRLRHGWTVHGPAQVNGTTENVMSHRIVIKEMESHKEILNVLESDFNDHRVEVYPGERGMSIEDKRFLQIANDGIKLENGHYTLPLPFRNDDVKLRNRSHAVKRILQQKKKMLANRQYYEDYKKFMDQLFEKGYAEKANYGKRWPVFVANRVQLIRSFTEPNQWSYVHSQSNPADEASRGLKPSEMLSSSMWLSGPEFLLRKLDEESVSLPFTQGQESMDCASLMAVEVEEASLPANSMEILVNQFSDWYRLKRAIAVYLKLLHILRDRVQMRGSQVKSTDSTHQICCIDLQRAEEVILRWQQKQSFPDEVELLKEDSTRSRVKSSLPKSSSLQSLDPFLEGGLLRVGGRLRRADLSPSMKHPVILPRKSHVTTLVIRNEHKSSGHAGRNHVLSQLRQKYWIIRANTTVRNVIHACVICRRLRGIAEEQKMSDLPDCRLDDTQPPFSHTGVDYFGHDDEMNISCCNKGESNGLHLEETYVLATLFSLRMTLLHAAAGQWDVL